MSTSVKITAEGFYIDGKYPEMDKHDKRANKFTYYDMIDFAENYAQFLIANMECDHPFSSVHTRCFGEINHCLKCGKDLGPY